MELQVRDQKERKKEEEEELELNCRRETTDLSRGAEAY